MKNYYNYAYNKMSSYEYVIPMIPAPVYYTSLGRYTKNHLGFMNFNPPLSDSTPYPYTKDKMIEFQPSYDTLIRGDGLSHSNYASVKDAYQSSHSIEKQY